MRLTTLRNSALCSLLGLGAAQSSSQTWAQSQPFDVDASTESLLSSAQQPLTNVVASSTPALTTGVPPAVQVTGEFSVSIPTELSSVGTVSSASVSRGSASGSASGSESTSMAGSRTSARPTSTGSGAVVQSTAAAALPVGGTGPLKMMGVAGALAGAAGVLYI